MSSAQWKLNTRIGAMYLVASDRGIQGIFWSRQKAPLVKSLSGREKAIRVLLKASEQVEAYLSGRLKKFTLPLDLVQGTEFQKLVWSELSRIPYGETRSYREIAEKVGKPKAFRAVGTANGKNPLSIVVPCHRVIAANGTLGGYAGGLKLKTHLLELERAIDC